MAQQYPTEYPSWLQPEDPPQPPAKRRSGLITAAAVLALILAVAVILNESVFQIRNIAVYGNETVSWDEVITLAGLKRSTGFFTLNEKKIAEGINSHTRLVFERLEKEFPNTLTIFVHERKEVVKVQEMGAFYFLDDEGMVLRRVGKTEVTKEEELLGRTLVMVTGLKPKDLRTGRIMAAGSAAHMEAYLELVQELEKQGYLFQVSELNITDPENLYLVTTDGYTAHLGDLTDLRAKIGTVRAVVSKLREMGKKNGMLEASVPGTVIYTPAEP